MKPTKLLAGLTTLTLISAAHADVTVTVTGSSAFRAATLKAIKAKYLAASSPSFKFAHDKAAGNFDLAAPDATRSIFIGNFPGVSGTTTIKCTFTGSVEGLRALFVGNTNNGSTVVDPAPPTYFPNSVLSGTTATAGGAELAGVSSGSAVALGTQSDIAFSDVAKAATPYVSQPTQPAGAAAGVIVFTMLTNDGSTITNVTTQQFKALLTNGSQPLSLFTGNPAHTTNVYASGRNDGSGTRASYLAETGYGVANTVQQYVVNTFSGDEITEIQVVPQGGGSVPANASTVWGQDVAGNGGYNSGSTLKSDFGRKGTAVTVKSASGATIASGVHADLVTWLAVNDAVGAKASGAVICAYNGVTLSDIAGGASTLGANDIAKVANGLYTGWNYEQMYRNAAIGTGTSDKKTVYDAIKTAIPSLLAGAGTGISIGDMLVGRPADGGVVAP